VNRRLAACLALALFAPAMTVAGDLDQYPRETKSRFDPRVKIVEYNPLAIVTIKQALGYSTHIQLAPDEEVVDVGAGDSLAWEVAPSGNHVFIKPREIDGRTNLAIVTTKRPYQFVVDVVPKEKLPDSEMTLFMVFMYPDDPQVKAEETKRAAVAEQVTAAMRTDAPIRNTNYEVCKRNAQINPMAVWDNGKFTYMKFRPGQSLPTVQAILPDGKEGLVNYRMGGQEGDGMADSRTMIIFEVAPKFIVRYGDAASCVINSGHAATTAALETEPTEETGSTKRGFLRIFRGDK